MCASFGVSWHTRAISVKRRELGRLSGARIPCSPLLRARETAEIGLGAVVTVVDMGVAADLCELASAGKPLSRQIGPGTQNMPRGPAMNRDDEIDKLMGR